MSKTLDGETSDETRNVIAEKLGLAGRALLEIPCSCYHSSNNM